MAEQSALAETEIIRQAQNGSQAAYGELYQRHSPTIYQYIHKRVRGSQEAEDLTQTVFLKAWQALREYQPSTAPFRAWLHRIAHNTVIDHYRTQRDLLLWDDLTWVIDPHCTPEEIVLDSERQETMHNAIAMLRPAYQEIIVHRFVRDMDYAKMAAELGRQVNNVRVLQHRALAALRRALAQESAFWVALVATAMLLLLSRTVVVAAEQALPGDGLYPLRTVVEEAGLWLADDATDIRLHTDFAAQRIAELQALSRQGRVKDVAATVVHFSAHIRAASAKLAVAAQAEQSDSEKLTTQFEQALQQQSAELLALASSAPPSLQSTIQPAIDAVVDAQANLHDSTLPADDAPSLAPAESAPDRNKTEPSFAQTSVITSAAPQVQFSVLPAATIEAQKATEDEMDAMGDQQPTGDNAPLSIQAASKDDANTPHVHFDETNPSATQTAPSSPVEAPEEPTITTPVQRPDPPVQPTPAAPDGSTDDHTFAHANGAHSEPDHPGATTNPNDHLPEAADNNKESHPQQTRTDDKPTTDAPADEHRPQQSDPDRKHSDHERDRNK